MDGGEQAQSLKYQAIHIGLDWEAGKMAVYTKLKSCFYMEKSGHVSNHLVCIIMADMPLKHYLGIIRVSLNSINVLHVQRKTLTTLILRANRHANFIYSQLYYNIIYYL